MVLFRVNTVFSKGFLYEFKVTFIFGASTERKRIVIFCERNHIFVNKVRWV